MSSRRIREVNTTLPTLSKVPFLLSSKYRIHTEPRCRELLIAYASLVSYCLGTYGVNKKEIVGQINGDTRLIEWLLIERVDKLSTKFSIQLFALLTINFFKYLRRNYIAIIEFK